MDICVSFGTFTFFRLQLFDRHIKFNLCFFELATGYGFIGIMVIKTSTYLGLYFSIFFKEFLKEFKLKEKK